MRKGKLIGKIFGIALVFVMIVWGLGSVPTLMGEVKASPGTIYVPDNYPTIQAAVDAAIPGDTIIVRDGTYTENVHVNKDHLTIQSENGAEVTIVQAANPSDHVFEVTADYITIKGLSIYGATNPGYAGICLNSVNNSTLENNRCGWDSDHKNRTGMYVYLSSDSTLSGNIANENNGSGIYLSYSSNNTLLENTCDKNCEYGIRIRMSSNNALLDNTCTDNQRGICVVTSSNNILSGNTANENNDYGICVSSSSDNILEDNIANSNDYGIYLRSSSNNILTNNTMTGNRYNFGIDSTDRYLSEFINNIDTSNEVDGKPIYYWINDKDKEIPNDAGYVGVINSTNITARDLTLKHNVQGVLLVHSTNSTIENVNASNNRHGIYLINSSYNNIASNIVESCAESGIILDYSPTPGPYLPPIGYNDPDDQWIDEPLAYDGDTDTFASVYVPCSGGSYGLELLAPPGKMSQGIRFWVNKGFLSVEIFYDGIWHGLKSWGWPYDPAPSGEWVVVDYPEESVEKARIRFSYGLMCPFYAHLSEFQFKTTLGISSSNNEIVRNTVSDSGVGIRLYRSSDNRIYLNNFTNNTDNGYSSDSSNLCNSPEQITYSYHGNAYTNYLGNYWSDYGVYSPAVGHNDPGDQWEDETLAYDENRDTFARVYLGGGMGSSPLELLAPSGKPTEGIRFWGSGGPLCVDIYYDGYWHCLQDWPWGISSAPANEWVELTYPSKIVEMARIIFHGRVLNGWSYLNEFQFKTVLDKSVLDVDGDGIGDTSYSIDSDKDNYPLVEPFENYEIGPENQPPVASFTCSQENPFSGDVVSFDASSSYDPDGTIVSYNWDFEDGETATGCHASHRFRGTMNESKIYTVTLTVEDNYGATATDTASITVEPLRKFVDVSPGYFGVSCWMEATYNWVGTDGATGENLYIISRINSYSGGFAGAYQLFILRRVSLPPSMPKLIWHIALPALPIMRIYTTPFTPSIWQEYWGTPAEPIKHTFPDGTFEGIEVTDTSLMVIVATGTEAFPLLYYDAGLTDFEPASPVTHLKAEELKEMWELKDVIDLLNKVIGILFSPGELRIYDSEGRVTGLVNGEIKEEIPGSMYTDGVILILYPVEPYRYEILGADEGTYGLEITSVKDGEPATFTATDIPTTSGTVHQYNIDWEALSEGEEGVTVQVDSDGDGITDYTLTADSELTGDEFISQFPGCFIATAAYGTPMAEEIEILREFRDEYLLTNPVGQGLVEFYYKVSPPMAEFITEHPSLKPIVRVGLLPAVAMSTVAVNTTPAEKTAIVGLLALVSVALAVWATRRRGRDPEDSRG